MVARNTLVFLILLCLAGCKNPSSDAPRVTDARFLNKSFTVAEPVDVNATIISVHAPITRYVWTVNGETILDAHGSSLSPENFSKGNVVSCEITAKDTLGRETEPVKAGPVTIQDSPPKITEGDIFPTDSIYKGIDLSVDVIAEDLDDDDISFRYKWYVDNKLVSSDSILDGQLLVAEKNVRVTIVPFDGDTTGESYEITRPIIIRNTPPKIIGTPEPIVKDSLIVCKINAEDPDGDPITYEIAEGPTGMTIDSTGMLQWKFPATGKDTVYSVTVKVTDPKGGGAKVQIPLKLTRTQVKE